MISSLSGSISSFYLQYVEFLGEYSFSTMK